MLLLDRTRKWLVNRTNPEYVEYLSRVTSVSPALAQILIARGIKTPAQASAFLNPSLTALPDPFDLPDMKKTVNRIHDAKKRGERVLIHGDYDADGVTATAIMIEGLRRFGIETEYFIPNRMAHGYGFGTAGIEKARQTDSTLIITVDCGIASFEAVHAARSLGIEVIITDHHEPLVEPEHSGSISYPARMLPANVSEPPLCFIIPDAHAVINPKLMFPLTSLAALSGAGVAFVLLFALFDGDLNNISDLLDLAALGTAADVVPLLAENRALLKEAFPLIQSGQRQGIRALKEVSGMKVDVLKASHLYFTLIPRINAAGRIEDANQVVKLLTTQSEAEAYDLALWLNDLNVRRQKIEETVYQEAKRLLDSRDDLNGAVVLSYEGWHPGVLGIVASRIAEESYKPTLIFSVENGIAKGSARSIPPFDICNGLSQCRHLLQRFGGHKQAAGISLLAENLNLLQQLISEIVVNSLSADDLIPTLFIDAAVGLSDITPMLVEELIRLEPFGYGNEEPVFGAKSLIPVNPRIVGNNHLKMYLKQTGGKGIDSIGFDFGDLIHVVESAGSIDAAFIPTINQWEGGASLQLNLRAIRPSMS